MPAINDEPSNENRPSTSTGEPQNTINASPTESVSQPNVETTEEGRGRKRMKWTNDMNKHLYRCYLTVTKMEAEQRCYRETLHQQMTTRYPELRTKTVQNIMDQKRQLLTKNKLTPEEITTIREEVSRELGLVENPIPPTTPIQQQTLVDSPRTPRDRITENTHESIFHKNFLMYNEMDPTRRPALPKLTYSRGIHYIISDVNKLISRMQNTCQSVTDVINLIYIGAATVLEANNEIRIKNDTQHQTGKSIKKQPCERRIKQKIDELRANIGILTQTIKKNVNVRTATKAKKLFEKHKDENNKTMEEVLDLLKQHLAAKSKRLRRLRESSLRRTQNALFSTNPKQFYRSMEGQTKVTQARDTSDQMPTKQMIEDFWSNIWSIPVHHRSRATWITEEKKKTQKVKVMSPFKIELKDVQATFPKMSNWKSPGVDKVHNFWIKKFCSLHHILAETLNKIVDDPENVPDFFTQGNTYLLPKTTPACQDPAKYRPITCLPTTYKLLTSVITNRIYEHLDSNELLSEEQKGCRRRSQGCKEQLVIDSIVNEEARKKKKDLYTAYIDYKKAFDSVLHSWLIETLNIYKVSPTIVRLLTSLMKKWTTTLQIRTPGKEPMTTRPINIARGIFQGDSLSALWFCLALNPISSLLNKGKAGYKLESDITVSHLIYMDDIKILAESKSTLQKLIKRVADFTADIRMEFGIDKCRINGMRKGKWEEQTGHMMDDNTIAAMDIDEHYRYLGFEQGTKLAHNTMKKQLTIKMCKRVRTILESKLSAINEVRAINTYAAPVIRYSFGIVK